MADPKDNAAPPFASRNGEAVDQPVDTTPPQQFHRPYRQPDPNASTPAMPPDYAASRPQQGADPQRVNPQSVPAGGTVTKADPGAASRAIGGQGTTAPRSPFRNMK